MGNTTGNYGDFELLQDDDGSVYMISEESSGCCGDDYIYKLTPDYLSVLAATATRSQMPSVAVPLDKRSYGEAPAVFKRDGWYYWGTANYCGYCPQGSGAYWWKSRHPLGPFQFACENGPTPDHPLLTNTINQFRHGRPGGGSARVVAGQQTHVTTLKLANGTTLAIWMADLWQSAVDHVHAHDGRYWAPLQFDADGDIVPFEGWITNFTVDVPPVVPPRSSDLAGA